MRKTLLILVLAAAVTWMFKYPDELQRYSSTFFHRASEFFASLAGKKETLTEEEQLLRTPPPVVLPPEGTYCVLQPVRVSSGGSSTLLPVGAWVRKVGEGNGKIVISDGSGTALVDQSYISNDPSVISALSQKLHVQTVARSSSATAVTQQTIQEIDAKLSALRTELYALRERDAIAARAGRKVHFDTSADFVQSNITALERRKADLLKEMSSRR